MRSTFQNAGSPLSLGIFFSIMVVVLSNSLPGAIQNGLLGGGVPAQAAAQASHIPPTGALFAAFLGYNPMESLLSPAVISQLSPTAQANLLGTHFFPSIIASPFMDSLRVVFWFSAFLAVVGAVCSWLRGSTNFVYEESETSAAKPTVTAEVSPALEFNKTEQVS